MSTLPFGRFFFRPSLAREITILLIVKVIALMILFYAFFHPANRIEISPKTVGQHLLAPQQDIMP